MSLKKPKHIAIIPDGNRRWAAGCQMGKHEGYQYGLDPGLRLLRAAIGKDVEEITYYGFTVDNCKRPQIQVNAFQEACLKAVQLIANEGTELLVIGNENSPFFPEELKQYRKRTSIAGGGVRVNFLVNYGWEWDLSHMMSDGKPYSQDVSMIDMVIRWGGMRRLSGLLPIQSVYADFYVEDKLWPDFDEEDFYKALAWYSHQDVTKGG